MFKYWAKNNFFVMDLRIVAMSFPEIFTKQYLCTKQANNCSYTIVKE